MAWGIYLVTKHCPGQGKLYVEKFEFIHKWQLGYTFGAWYIMYVARQYAMINSNGVRAIAGVGQPDQYAYISSDEKPVVLVSAGAKGRFNRAQRAAFNMDESLPLFSTGLFLASSVFGPFTMALAVWSMIGRINFANSYKNNLDVRSAGLFAPRHPEVWVSALVCLCAFKGIAGPAIKL